MKNKCQCKGCESRYIGCHGECPSYIAFSEERNEFLNIRNEYLVKRADVDSQKMDIRLKTLKRDKTIRTK